MSAVSKDPVGSIPQPANLRIPGQRAGATGQDERVITGILARTRDSVRPSLGGKPRPDGVTIRYTCRLGSYEQEVY